VDGGKSMCLKQGTSPQRTEKVRSVTRKAAANFSLKHLKFFTVVVATAAALSSRANNKKYRHRTRRDSAPIK